jgi:LmbE family N-acetylglucosaminyl deacetylase
MVKKIVIAPHIDDEVLGCGSILDENTHVIYVGNGHSKNVISKQDRIIEADAVSSFLGHSYTILSHEVDKYEVYPLINDFEEILQKYRPEELYVVHPSYNQDHKTVYDAVMTATRPHDNNWFVKKIFLYEQPQLYLWNNTNREFKPNYFVELDIKKKIDAYKLMPSQVRSFRSPELLQSMAMVRGKQSNYEYAEAFEIIRWIK